MKLSIQTNIIGSEDLPLYFSSHCIDLIINELLKKEGDYEEGYNYLFKKYQEYLTKKDLPAYKMYSLADTYEEKIKSLVLTIERENPFVFYATMLELANKYNLNYIKLFILIDYKLSFSENHKFNTKLIFKKEDVKYIAKLLTNARDVKLLKLHKRVSHLLLEQSTGKKIEHIDLASKFIDELNDKINQVEYILFEDYDEYINNQNTYTNTCEVDFKKILLSEDFHEYLKEDESFNNFEVSNFEEYLMNYVEEGGVNISERLIEEIIKIEDKDSLYTKAKVKELSVKEQSLL